MISDDEVEAIVHELVAQRERLGLVWRLIPGTILSVVPSGITGMVDLDGDAGAAPARTTILTGAAAPGQRVMNLHVPPDGLYTVGRLGFGVPNIEQILATGDWTKPPGFSLFRVQVQAAGGAGGGSAATIAGQWSFGDGGGGGEYAEGWFLAADLPAVVPVTVGAGGVGASGTSGTVGGNSAFGTLITTVGGGAAAVRPASAAAHFSQSSQLRGGGAGGVGGTLRIAGSPGGSGFAYDSVAANQRGGDGGASHLAGGRVAPDANNNGNTGRSYGGGGSGTANIAAQAARTGGNGGPGIVIITGYA